MMSNRLYCDRAKAQTLARAYRQLYDRQGGASNLRQAKAWEEESERLARVEAEARRAAEIVEECIG